MATRLRKKDNTFIYADEIIENNDDNGGGGGDLELTDDGLIYSNDSNSKAYTLTPDGVSGDTGTGSHTLNKYALIMFNDNEGNPNGVNLAYDRLGTLNGGVENYLDFPNESGTIATRE